MKKKTASKLVSATFAGVMMLSNVFAAAAQEAAPLPGPAVPLQIQKLPDLTAHPLAGETVKIRVRVRDGSGKESLSEVREITLPKRIFKSPDVNELAESILTVEGESEASTAAVSALFDSWLRERSLLLARIELTMEAARDPELAQPLIEERARMVELITHVITAICVDDAETRAAAVISALDGVLIGGLLHADEAQRTAFLTTSIGLILNEVAGARTLH